MVFLAGRKVSDAVNMDFSMDDYVYGLICQDLEKSSSKYMVLKLCLESSVSNKLSLGNFPILIEGIV